MSDAGLRDARAVRPWPAFLVCAAVVAITILDLTKINIGLPAIERSLGATDAQLQLLVSGYVLAFGLSLVPSGRLGDIFSRKVMFVAGIAVFILSSVLCAVAGDTTTLLVGRVLQGVAAGVQMPQALGLVQELFTGRDRARAFGYIGSVIAVSTAVGPAVGGLLTGVDPETGWRLLFWINVPVAGAALVAALVVIPRSGKRSREGAGLDPVGLLLFGAATVSVMLPFVTIEHVSDGPARWLWLLAAAAAVVALVRWERRYERLGRTPVLPSSLLKLPSFRNGLLIMATFFSSVSAVYFVIALYLQDGQGATPLVAGLVNIPQAVTSALGALIGARLVWRHGRRVVLIGIVLVTAGFAALIPVAFLVPAELSPLACALALAVAGAGTGLVIAPNQTITVSEVPVRFAGVAASLTQLAQRIGIAVGLSAMSAVFFGALGARAGRTDEGYRDAFVASVWLGMALLVVSSVFAMLDVRRRAAPLERSRPARRSPSG